MLKDAEVMMVRSRRAGMAAVSVERFGRFVSVSEARMLVPVLPSAVSQEPM